MNRVTITTALAGLLCAVLLLTSCGTLGPASSPFPNLTDCPGDCSVSHEETAADCILKLSEEEEARPTWGEMFDVCKQRWEQKHVGGIAETQIPNNGSPASIQATETPVETSKSDETYDEARRAEAGPEAEPEGSPRESEQEEPDEKTTVGDVAIGALKVMGTVVLFALYLGLAVLVAL